MGVSALSITFLLHGRERLAFGWNAFAILSLGFLIHSSVFLNYRTQSVGQEPVVGSQVSIPLRAAATEIAYYSRYYSQTATVEPELKIATLWYLREATNVRFSSGSSDGISLKLVRSNQITLDPGSERRPGLFVPSIDSRSLSWREIWGWLVMRDGLVRTNQRDIIVRSPAGNW